MKLHLARWLMRRRAWPVLPMRVQHWAIHQHLLTYASYRRFLELGGRL